MGSASGYVFRGEAVRLLVCLSRAELLGGLSAEELIPVTELVEIRRLEDGEVLCEAGEAGEALYLIVHGELRVERDGRTVSRLGPGEVAGELALLDGGPRTATLRAVGPVEIHAIAREDFLEMLDAHPALAGRLLAMVSRRLLAGGKAGTATP